MAALFIGTYAALDSIMSCPSLIFIFTTPLTTLNALQAVGYRQVLTRPRVPPAVSGAVSLLGPF